MALLRCDVFSEALSLSTSMTVILPQPTTTQIGMTGGGGQEPPPVLYLLHGLSDDDTIWLRRTSIERYVAPLGLAVVMPQVHRSFYADEAYGLRYWTFVSQELPELVGRFFRVSQAREDTFVAGGPSGWGSGPSSPRGRPGLLGPFSRFPRPRGTPWGGGLPGGGSGALTPAPRPPAGSPAGASLSGALDVTRLSRSTREEDP